jgi:hypothetical protein
MRGELLRARACQRAGSKRERHHGRLPSYQAWSLNSGASMQDIHPHTDRRIVALLAMALIVTISLVAVSYQPAMVETHGVFPARQL